MHSISMDLSKFEQYALPQSASQFVMPTDKTVVSVDKNGNPVSYFWQDKWDYNAFFNLTNEIESLYQINFHSDKHNPMLLLELKQRIYLLSCSRRVVEHDRRYISQIQPMPIDTSTSKYYVESV